MERTICELSITIAVVGRLILAHSVLFYNILVPRGRDPFGQHLGRGGGQNKSLLSYSEPLCVAGSWLSPKQAALGHIIWLARIWQRNSNPINRFKICLLQGKLTLWFLNTHLCVCIWSCSLHHLWRHHLNVSRYLEKSITELRIEQCTHLFVFDIDRIPTEHMKKTCSVFGAKMVLKRPTIPTIDQGPISRQHPTFYGWQKGNEG